MSSSQVPPFSPPPHNQPPQSPPRRNGRSGLIPIIVVLAAAAVVISVASVLVIPDLTGGGTAPEPAAPEPPAAARSAGGTGSTDDAEAAPCDLLTAAEVEQAFGQPTVISNSDEFLCMFTLGVTGTETSKLASLSISQPAQSSFIEDFQATVEDHYTNFRPASTIRPVSGVGDDAAAVVFDDREVRLEFLAGDAKGSVSVSSRSIRDDSLDVDATVERLTQLARIAVDRLG
jgi:hypothetical protein